MSFITRCPACATAFKVVSDQLKISEGWVRCGHCQHVFDATLDLQPWWPGAEPVTLPAAPPPDQAPPLSPLAPAAVLQPTPRPEAEPEPAALSPWEPGLAQVPSPEAGPHVPSEPEPRPEPEPEPEPELAPEAGVVLPPVAVSEPDAATAPAVVGPDFQPSFVQQAQRRALWRRPGVRWALAVVLAVLLLLLGLQASLHWRDDLAARVPQAEPALTTLCAPLDCEVAPPRQLENVLIDSSVLLRRAPGRYTFNLVVRNAAAMEVAAPALELTLTDIHDQVLVRRVIPAEEWPQPRTTLAPGAEWPVQFELELASPEAQVMTGYRAILFYP
ncbi:DUF3426 domain-containing protein [Aquabacterium sp. A08]|uniref:DUF3426 domain-containing protein n=1 Tax=Aquabacterium sp. A08 TaxID=2718532 RepID=UPI00141E22CE|nr:DUF3426 domain-containing protein [Aquabacterium sp. A08]NIC43147.1 DUF3426 domain-containing protein [Aquabacterium sp. A08]